MGAFLGISAGLAERKSSEINNRAPSNKYQAQAKPAPAASMPVSPTVSSHKQEQRRNSIENDDHVAAVATRSRGDTVPFSPSLPDVTSAEPSRAFQSESYFAFFIKNANSWGEKAGLKPTITYPYTFVIYELQTRRPVHFVTLEVSTLGTKCVGVFDMGGGHKNLGRDDLLDDEHAFIDRAIELVQAEFGERFHELSLKRGARRHGGAFS